MPKSNSSTKTTPLRDMVPSQVVRPTDSGDRPVVRLTGRDAQIAENYAGIYALQKEVDRDIDDLEAAVTDILLKEYLAECQKRKQRSPNLEFTTGGSNGMLQVKGPPKLLYQRDDKGNTLDAEKSLIQLGFDKKAAKEMASVLVEKTETTIDLPKIQKDKPELAAKVEKLLKEGLTREELGEVFQQKSYEQIGEHALFVQMLKHCTTTDQMKTLLTKWARMTLSLSGIDFRRGMNGVYQVMAQHRAQCGGLSFIHGLNLGREAEQASGSM